MDEAELVAATIDVINSDGWTIGAMGGQGGNDERCVLGSLGRARWGAQWDIDCCANVGALSATWIYQRIANDPVAYSVVKRIADVLTAESPELLAHRGWAGCSWDQEKEQYRGESYLGTVCDWNDQNATTKAVITVLEKVQAEVGFPREKDR